ncbi:MAG TPA: DUF4965 domain-containing protein [Bryobacteraceae bacterium]|jgi:hypothetical protein|nr:DUF4965 domain-containing protein [Bryobacteraceae bacterium]
MSSRIANGKRLPALGSRPLACKLIFSQLLIPLAFGADFRPPAVPLITHDPYFSIWSMADHLTDQPTKHWTGAVQPLSSLIRIDGKCYRIMGAEPKPAPVLQQTHLEVLPTHTVYQFEGAGVQVTLTFFTPALPPNLDTLSRNASYITWSVQSSDAKTHRVEIYFDAGSQIVVNTPEELVHWERYRVGDLQILRMGSEQQPVLQKSGDNLRIDWGYLYLAAPPESAMAETATVRPDAMRSFSETGAVPDADDLEQDQPYAQPAPALALSFELGNVASSPVARHVVLAYDDIYSIEYFHRRLRPYWRRNKTGIADLLRSALRDYESLDKQARAFDRELMSDLTAAGGEEYARLCALAYPQTLAAHKLTADIDGTPLFFSKENFSNGSIDTVDVTYPSSPFFLLFNTKLLEAQLKPVLDYANLPRWTFPFAPHDLGRYPLANGQQYGGKETSLENQMPVEESGNMLLMIAAASQVDGNADFAGRYWPLLTKWAEYLRGHGLDPENQLSTDDFAGHLAHNANLSIKAILALGAYGKLAGMLGHPDVMKDYLDLARSDARKWVEMDTDGDHYKLAFDRPSTWSQKYNLVWDHLLGFNFFPKEVTEKALAFYRTHENKYGLPLDNRADYTKLDWLAWTSSLGDSKQQFMTLFDPAYRFANESPSRVPLTDWYDTQTGKQIGFQARSVVGGIFIRMLYDPAIWKKYAQMAK